MIRASLALVVVACTGDDGVTESGTTTPTGPNDIVAVAQATPELSTLVGLVEQAGLVETLQGEGPFTVFAPTDDAFAGVDAAALTDDELRDILTYHVVPGRVDSSSVPALADSVATWTLFFDTSDGVRVNDATVTTPDVNASNGIVHIIDEVLLPPDILDAAGYAGLTSLAGAIGAADGEVATALSGEGPFTVFAPTDEAFGAITAPTDPGELADVLFYHVYPGAVDSASIPPKAESALVNASGISVSALFSTEGGVSINDANVAIADVRTTNGIVHVIDKVLLPPDIVDMAGLAGLTELAAALGAAPGGLDALLRQDGPFTVFAPTDMAFSMAPAVSGQALAAVLSFHVLDFQAFTAPVLLADLADGEVATALGGTDTITVDTSTGTVEGANIAISDVNATNGTVHVIDQVMIPPSFD